MVNESEKDCRYCAVNVFRYAFGNTIGEACGRLAQATRCGDPVWTDEDTNKYQLRVFKFKVGHLPDRWEWYCPKWNDETPVYWLIEDTMRDWEWEDLPMKIGADTIF